MARSGWQRPPGATSGWTGATGADPAIGLRALANRVELARRAALDAMALASVRDAKVELSKPGKGRVYLRQNVRGEAGGRVRNVRTGRFAKAGTLLRVDRQGRVRQAASGRFVSKSGKNRHVASRPGDPPAPDTGNLRNSVGWERENNRGGNRVGTGVEYGAILQLEKNRPWLSTTMARMHRLFGGLMTSGLKRAASPNGGAS